MRRLAILSLVTCVVAGCSRAPGDSPGTPPRPSTPGATPAAQPSEPPPVRPARRTSPVAPIGEGAMEPLEARTYALAFLEGDRLVRGGSVGVTVESVADPASLQSLGHAVLPGSVNGLVALDGDLVAAACGSEGVYLVDAGASGGPVRAGHLDTGGAAWRFERVGDHVLLADGHRGVALLDLRRPDRPRELSRWRSEGYARHVRVAGEGSARRGYVAEGRAGLAVLDLSSPTSPQLLSRLDTDGEARSVDLRSDVAFVADFHEGVLVADISNPARPRALARLETPDSARDVLSVGEVLFVAVGTEGLLVADAASPESLSILARRETAAPAVRLALRGDHLFVAVDSSGVEVYDVTDPSQPRKLEAPAEGDEEE